MAPISKWLALEKGGLGAPEERVTYDMLASHSYSTASGGILQIAEVGFLTWRRLIVPNTLHTEGPKLSLAKEALGRMRHTQGTA
jgi:hypothetical protein